jgi:hypothetical protein
VFLAFVPALHHAWTFAASLRTFGLLIAVILGIAVVAIALLSSAVSNPLYFLPVAAITVGLRLSSPILLYRRVRDRFDAAGWWTVGRWGLAVVFLGLAAILVYHLFRLASGLPAETFALLSEQILMASGASALIVRAGLRIRPRDNTEAWPIWAAAVLLALAFVVVLPYAVPAFEAVYAVSGLIGWILAVLTVVRDI